MTALRKKAEEFIDLFVKNFIVKLYPKVRKFRVGVVRSKGKATQANLSGGYHRNYQQEDVTIRHANERPFLIILVLDEFNFQYKKNVRTSGESLCSHRPCGNFFKCVESLWRGKREEEQ
jgi:hypothetical protein